MTHRYTAKLVLHHYEKQDGTRQLLLQAILNRQRVVVPTGISIPAAEWDEARQRVRRPGAKDYVRDTNLYLQARLAQATSVFVDARIRNRPLTRDLFRQQMAGGAVNDDFLAWYQAQMHRERHRHQPITHRNHGYTLDKLRAFAGGRIPFGDISPDWARRWDKYLRTTLALAPNTVHKHHRFTRKFLRLAIEEGLLAKDPYLTFRPARQAGRRRALTRDELARLVRLHDAGALDPLAQRTLRGFLASVYAGGIRFGDLAALTREHLRGDRIVFVPQKTRRFGRIVEVPLTDHARRYLDASGECLVSLPCNQLANRALKEIAAAAGIAGTLSFHVARHTFATRSLAAGMKPEVVKRIMGISSWSVIDQYVHITQDRAREEMEAAADRL